MGEDDARRRGAHLQQRSHSFCGGDCRQGEKQRARAVFLEKENETGSTWELMYFIVNEEKTDVPIEKLNPLFGYQPHYRPQGFSMINETAVSASHRVMATFSAS